MPWLTFALGVAVVLVCSTLLWIGVPWTFAKFSSSDNNSHVLTSLPTQSPPPTRVRLPTQLAPTPTPLPVVAKVIERRVNLGAEPSTQAKSVAYLKKDERITLIAQSDDGAWYQALDTNSSGPTWVFGENLQIESGDARTLPRFGAADQ